MKQANIKLMLSKEHEIVKKDVTPLEALLLVSLHHRNAGGNPVEVLPDTETEAEVTISATKAVGQLVEDVAEYKTPDGKTVPASKKVVREAVAAKEESKRSRTNDEEIARLRRKYSSAAIDTILTKVRDLPDTFEDAIKKGTGVILDSGKLSETKITL